MRLVDRPGTGPVFDAGRTDASRPVARPADGHEDDRAWWPPSRLDVALAAAIATAVAAAIAARIEEDAQRPPDAGAYALAVALGAVLLVRRRWPVGVALATIVLLFLYYSLGYGAVGFAVPVSAAFYSVAESGRLRTAVGLAASTFAASMGFRLFIDQHEDRSVLLGYEMGATAATLLAVIALGEAVRTRRALGAEIAERSRRASLDRQHEAVRQVQAERLRIARDIHDVLAHTVAVMSIQSAVAGEALDDLDTSAARTSVAAIRAASAEALGELRTTVGLLRAGADPDGLAPAPGLAELGRLVANARQMGLTVRVQEVGPARPLPPVVDLTAHRILQESITNVIRHAHAATAIVELRHSPGQLVVEVTDDGRGLDAGKSVMSGGGFGIQGMRERVAAVGGHLDVGPAPAGGFRVTARLPTQR